MHQKFNKDYIQQKFTHDESVNLDKSTLGSKTKIIRDTYANKLLTEAQQALAKSLNEREKNIRSSVDAIVSKDKSNVTLPPLIAKGRVQRNSL
jgi:hypothetical protein